MLPKLGLRDLTSLYELNLEGAFFARVELFRLLATDGAGAAPPEPEVPGRRSGEISLSSGTALGS